MTILVTGGAGYIGSHTCVELLNQGDEVVVFDNLCNSSRIALERVEEITGKPFTFYEIDLLDRDGLHSVFERHEIEAVIHFAALKAVGESVVIPLKYYHNNVVGSIHLFEAAMAANVRKIVFSSSATVYGNPASVPITENFPVQPTNPYGWTKAMIEQILIDLQAANPELNVTLLRYFNPVGAHPSGLIGESPNGTPNNLMPYISQVAVGKLPELLVFGNDYPTVDGTGVRDYIHVVDLAQGHLAALEAMKNGPGLGIYNLGTGNGFSVLELIQAFEQASGRPIPYRVAGRRPGDVAESYADPSLANRELGWRALLGIEKMCADTWRWQSRNPNGFSAG
jgi:UDP-glucose 4-epimerase